MGRRGYRYSVVGLTQDILLRGLIVPMVPNHRLTKASDKWTTEYNSPGTNSRYTDIIDLSDDCRPQSGWNVNIFSSTDGQVASLDDYRLISRVWKTFLYASGKHLELISIP